MNSVEVIRKQNETRILDERIDDLEEQIAGLKRVISALMIESKKKTDVFMLDDIYQHGEAKISLDENMSGDIIVTIERGE